MSAPRSEDGLPPVEAGEGVVAFFDMDLTLLTVNSARLWLDFERAEGRLGLGDMLRGLSWMFQYRLGVVDMEKVTAKALSLSKGQSAADLEARCRRWYARDVRPHISEAARARLEAHRAAGHRPVVLTASTQYGSRPLAEELEVELISTRLTDTDGVLDGGFEDPLCFGEGKWHHAERWLASEGLDPADAWFYTDSLTDLPVLERVGHPVVVNADPRLAREASRRGWPEVDWRG